MAAYHGLGARGRQLLAIVGMQGRRLGVTFRRTEINGQPGAMFLDPGGADQRIHGRRRRGVIQTVRSIINPEKLRHLGRLADGWVVGREGAP